MTRLPAIGAVLGLITRPRLLVLLMAVFAGHPQAGSPERKVAWGEIGEIGGQIVGGSVGGLAWAVWLYSGRGKARDIKADTLSGYFLHGKGTSPYGDRAVGCLR